MNIGKFTRHVASRKAMPVLMETKRVRVEMPPPCEETDPNMSDNKCQCEATLPEGIVERVSLDGRRQWIRLRVSSRWLDQQFDALNVPRSETLYLSRYKTDYQGKMKVPLRFWTPEMEPLEHKLQKGDVVKCAMHELRAYENNGRQCSAELYRDIVVVRKNKKRPRVVNYFSDGDE